MKLIYCTLFDSNYLSRGLVMYDSLLKHCPDFHLYVFAFDDKCLEILQKLNLKNLTPIILADYEDEELLKVKPSRTRAEYCWTNTPSTVWYVLNHFEVSHCTYLDADMLFYANPQPLYDEMGEKSILITEHRYTDNPELMEKAGIYNVQYVTFKNDDAGREACLWWRNACIDWCFDKFEEGKFGDQKYLDDWPTRFPSVQVLEHEGGGLATWNIQRYFIQNERSLSVKNRASGIIFPAIFYHFHALKFYAENIVFFTPDYIDKDVLDVFYFPYTKLLLEKRKELISLDKSFEPNGTLKPSPAKPLTKRDKLYLYRTEISDLLLNLRFVGIIKKVEELRIKFEKHHYYYIDTIA